MTTDRLNVTFWSGVHRRILGLATLVDFLTYTDRVCIAVTAPAMMRDLHLDSLKMGVVFSFLNHGEWSHPLLLPAGLYFIGALCWCYIETDSVGEELEPCHF